ncbi:MAG: hypothetical protein G01um101420_93 [Parcubacteria group bacterium Gr01-1014_20]|nr:MAG: hypothetical protein G01um101420_93 [Parcubacteria group bacterium Gr01-1014_20]
MDLKFVDDLMGSESPYAQMRFKQLRKVLQEFPWIFGVRQLWVSMADKVVVKNPDSAFSEMLLAPCSTEKEVWVYVIGGLPNTPGFTVVKVGSRGETEKASDWRRAIIETVRLSVGCDGRVLGLVIVGGLFGNSLPEEDFGLLGAVHLTLYRGRMGGDPFHLHKLIEPYVS